MRLVILKLFDEPAEKLVRLFRKKELVNVTTKKLADY